MNKVDNIMLKIAAIKAKGNCVLTWSIRSQPVNILDTIVVSDIGEHWSPNTVPPRTAPKHTLIYKGSGLIEKAKGIAIGKTTAYVPNAVPVEKVTIIHNMVSIAGKKNKEILPDIIWIK